MQVSGLSYTLTPSVRTPGRVDITVRWNAVTGAEKYIVWDKTGGWLLGEVPGAVYTEPRASISRPETKLPVTPDRLPRATAGRLKGVDLFLAAAMEEP